ncbi:MAG: hypothetical protein ACREPF_09205 [Rhodanobacteraceae bacterium]
MAFITGCSVAQGDPKHPELNPHPQQRYAVTATVEAPGPFDSVHGRLVYEISNRDCVPKDPLTGGQNVPSYTTAFELARVDGHTYRGYFYRDLLRGGDYFGLGMCHWEIMNAGADLVVHGLTFVVVAMPYDTQTGRALELGIRRSVYFRTADYTDGALNDGNYWSPMHVGKAESAPEGQAPFAATVFVKEDRS